MGLPESNQDKAPSSYNPLSSPTFSLLFLIVASLTGGLFGSLLLFSLGHFSGFDLSELLNSISPESPRSDRDLARLINLVSHIFTFTIPAIFVAFFLYQKGWLRFLKLTKAPTIRSIILSTLFIVAAFPVAQFSFWLNRQLPLPDWATEIEGNAEAMIQGLLIMESPIEFWFNLLIMAILPAIGEELVFRGIVQQKIQQTTKNPVTAIWITAILFSAIHLQFEGFIPRMVLGAALGYLFYWTSNLWVPILAHFVTNGMQITAQYLFASQMEEMTEEAANQAPWAIAIIALIILFGLGYQLSSNKIVLEENSKLE